MIRATAVAWALLAPGLLAAEEKFDIKLKKRQKGDAVTVAYEEKTTNAMTVTGPDGKVVEKKNQQMLEAARFREDVLEKEPGKRPTRLKRTYEKASVTLDGKAEDFEYSGKAVTIEKAAGGYTFTLDGGKVLKGKAAGLLAKEFTGKKSDSDDVEEKVLPKKPVAVGDTWDINVKEFLKELSGEDEVKAFDLDKAKGAGKLAKAYKRGDQQFGVLEIDLTTPLVALPGTEFKCESGSKFNLKLTLDVCIDGSAEAGNMKGDLKFAGKAKGSQGGMDFGLEFDVSVNRNDTHEPVKK
jgi:hypothetical protein